LRSDIPILNDVFETSVPGIFIVGELGGMALIRHGINQGTRTVDEIARRLQNIKCEQESNGPADILIVGCGPAGIAATLRAKQLDLNYITIDQDQDGLGGAVKKYPHNKVAMMQPVHVPLHGRLRRTKYRKEQLLQLWQGLFSRLDIKIRHGEELRDIKTLADGTLSSKTSKETIVSRFVILALGRHGTPRRLNVPGEESDHVFYHLDNPADYRDQSLLVVGGGDSAAEAAIVLAQEPGNHVTLSYRREEFFRVRRRNLEHLNRLRKKGRLEVIFNSRIKQIENDHVILMVSLEQQQTEKRLPISAIFILVGGSPPFNLLRRIGIRFGTQSLSDSPSGFSSHDENSDISEMES
jgi:thioredoxin reductase